MSALIPLLRLDRKTREVRVVGYANVDEADYDRLAKHRWGMITGAKTSYAVRSEHIPGTSHGCRTFYMHREVLGLPHGTGHEIEADHIDFQGLNNTRANLRTVTRSEQMKNRRPWKNKPRKAK